MNIKHFKVTLLEDTVISERSATEGRHGSLNYLPGSSFLGAVAARLYQQLHEDAYIVFHSGKVRFGNALPLSEDDQLSYPMPLCLYQKKDDSKIVLHNYQHGEFPKTTPAKQVRGDSFVSLAAIDKNKPFTKITPRFRMKTAIDPELGTARNSQLFGYNSLPASKEFVFTLESDDDVDPSLLEKIANNLQKDNLKLGRSRSAEFGAVEIKLFDQEDQRILPAAASEVTLWLLADAALQDEFGQPLLLPTAASIGLPSHFELNTEKTFIRTRTYAAFNTHRRYRELERVVLNMGSVLHFSSKETVDETTLQAIQNQGIGLYRQAGLGRVWINPSLLATKSPKFKTLKPPKQEESVQKEKPNHLVLRYLDKRKGQVSNTNRIEEKANEWIKELRDLYESAQKLSSSAVFGPSKTQWGTIMEVANNIVKNPPKDATPYKTLAKKLFIGEHAICKKVDEQWSQRVLYEEDNIYNFRRWLLYKVCSSKERELRVQVVARFALLARRIVD